MVLPADFARLTVPEQLFVAIDRERVDRGLAPFTGPHHRPRLPTRRRGPTRPGSRRGRAAATAR